MWIKDILWNKGVQWASFVPAIDAINTIWWNLTWLNSGAEFWNVFWNVKWAVDSILDMTWANTLMASNPLLSQTLLAWGAWLLSNKVLKDLWLVWEKTLWVKNLTRYALNWAAMLWTYSAWTVAAPYLAAWAWAYFIWKHGWKFWKEIPKAIYSGIGWTLKNIITSPIAWYKSIKNSAWSWNFKINPQTN